MLTKEQEDERLKDFEAALDKLTSGLHSAAALPLLVRANQMTEGALDGCEVALEW